MHATDLSEKSSEGPGSTPAWGCSTTHNSFCLITLNNYWEVYTMLFFTQSHKKMAVTTCTCTMPLQISGLFSCSSFFTWFSQTSSSEIADAFEGGKMTVDGLDQPKITLLEFFITRQLSLTHNCTPDFTSTVFLLPTKGLMQFNKALSENPHPLDIMRIHKVQSSGHWQKLFLFITTYK